MVGFTRYSLLVFSVIAFTALLFTVLDTSGNQRANRNDQRTKDVQFYINKIEAYAKANGSVPSFSSSFQQVGTAASRCEISNEHCQISTTECLDVNMVMNDKELTLPSDVRIGSIYKTGYAVKYDSALETAVVVACGAEQEASISAEKNLHDWLNSGKVNGKK